MKKSTFFIIATCLLLSFYPLQSNAEATKTAPTSLVVSTPPDSPEAKALLLRLDEIKAMDKSNMKSSEKRVLRKEVRVIKHQLNELYDGIYLSVGAIIIIILLLIILL